MNPKFFLGAAFAITSILGIPPLALAHTPYRHQAHYAHVRRATIFSAIRPSRANEGVSSPPMIAFQGYAGPAYLGHGGIPQSPLTPLKTEVPPPVDPNEPTSGSYGAMVHGFNAAGTGY